MKRAILILVSLLSFALGNVLPSLAQHPFYIYRNDGGFNAFYHDDIDSIMYSNYDADSIYHADIVSQVIYAYDSVFVIPLAAIDSVSFITPETVYKPGVRVIDDLAEYVNTSDSLSFVLAYATPQNLLPKVGEKVITSVSTIGFPEGFVGEVLSLENVAEGIKFSCERVSITDIYEVYFGLSQGGEYGAETPRCKVKEGGNQGPVIIRPGIFGPDLREEITGEYRITDDIALRFTPDLAYTLEPVWTITPFVIVKPEIGLYVSAVCVADYMYEERLGGTGTLQWKKDFPIPILSRDHIPVHFPWLYFYEEVGGFLRADFSGAYKAKWNQHFRQTIVFEYSSKGEQMLKRHAKEPRLVNKSHEDEGLLNGSVALGGYVELGFTLADKRIDRVGLRGELGFEASAQAVLTKRDFEAASRSTALYEQMHDCGFAVNFFANVTILAATGPWSVEWTPFPYKKELWRMSYVPEFLDVKAKRLGAKAHCEMIASGKILNPVGVGFKLLDQDDNSIVSEFAEYTGEAAGYELDFPNVPRRKRYTVYPTVKAWDYTMLATPTAELPQAELPVRITSFKQTDSHYKENGYTYDGWTYSYEYDVTVTVELTDPEGVADWGYVYEDPNGKIARISLNGFSSPYPDDRYVYYRNEDKSTVRLYEYVKYEGSEEYEYGEPVDYNIQYKTIRITTGEVETLSESYAEICGYVEGVESGTVVEAGISYKKAYDDSWNFVSAQIETDGYFFVYVDGLLSGTTYNYRAYAYADGEYYYGEVYDFTTDVSVNICPDDNHPHMIDLGLPSGTKWACCNVDASAPVEYGGYYAWGETEEKDNYTMENYKYAVIDDENGDFYNGNDIDPHYYRLIHIGDDIAGTRYDVAHMKWGGSWRMPSIEHFQELIDNCNFTYKWVYDGYCSIFTGPNGNSIVLPCAGWITGDNYDNQKIDGFYWASTLNPAYDLEEEHNGQYREFYADCLRWNNDIGRESRCLYGYTVRPICP